MNVDIIKEEQVLLDDLNNLIEDSKQKVLVKINTELVLLYWHVGTRINRHILGNQRAGYGKEIIRRISAKLIERFGKGWNDKTLWHCLRCAETFTEEKIVSAVRRQLSWTHIKTIVYIKDELQREFYLTMTSNERWSSRQLQERINSMLYERTAISKKPELVIQNDLELLRSNKGMTKDLTFKDPYILSFLGLEDTYSEKDLEQSIIYQLQLFYFGIG